MLKRLISFGLFMVVGSAVVYAEPSVYGTDSEEFQRMYEADVSAPVSAPVSASSVTATPQQPATLTSLRRQIERQNERIDGLTTLVEGLSAQLFELQQQRGAVSAAPGTDNTELLKKLADMIDKINRNYVSKEELEQILAGMNGKSAPKSKKEKASTDQKVSLEGKENAALYTEGVRLFGKKQYNEAKERFVITDQKGYKPAASNYYLGEIAYYTKAYEDAIFYYKKSAGLYDKASYIDVLLLHTGISLEKTGQKDQAKLFYQNIVENYSGHRSAQIAKDKLKKL
jgi:TolA-binding protein